MTQPEQDFIKEIRVWLLGFASTLIIITSGTIINSHYQVKRLSELINEVREVKMDKATFNYYMDLMEERENTHKENWKAMEKQIDELKKYKWITRGGVEK